MAKNDVTEWDELSSRRKEVLTVIYEEFGTDTQFTKDQLNNLLETDTTLGLLDELWEDGYLEVINRGGTPMLLALISNEDNQREFAAEDQEELANDMVNRENLGLDAEDYDWTDNEERYEFCDTFNEGAKEKHEDDDEEPIQLNATFTRNIYKLTEEGAEVIEDNIKDEDEE